MSYLFSGDEDLEREKCQSIYRNLLLAKAVLQTQDASVQYLREWITQTARCDKFHDMSDVRRNYTNQIGQRAINRITDYEETKSDTKKVNQAVMHYATWHEKRLVSALSWPNWIHHHTIFRWERFLIALGVVSAIPAGYRVLRSSAMTKGGK